MHPGDLRFGGEGTDAPSSGGELACFCVFPMFSGCFPCFLGVSQKSWVNHPASKSATPVVKSRESETQGFRPVSMHTETRVKSTPRTLSTHSINQSLCIVRPHHVAIAPWAVWTSGPASPPTARAPTPTSTLPGQVSKVTRCGSSGIGRFIYQQASIRDQAFSHCHGGAIWTLACRRDTCP